MNAQEFERLLENANEDMPEPGTQTLHRILHHHGAYVERMGEIATTQPALWSKLAQEAEELCLHLQRPLMHRRRAWYVEHMPEAPSSLKPIRKYKLLSKFRDGSMESQSFVARHPDGFICLIKQYFPDAVELEREQMFRHQERIIQKLNVHPSPEFEEVLDHFLWGERSYIQVKPYLRCMSLWDWMEMHPSRCERVLLLRRIGRLLVELHKQGICHMDLKPDQLLILPEKDGTWSKTPGIVLIDFDFSMVDGMLTLSVGSVPYYAPEQFYDDAPKGLLAGKNADVYAFSVFVHRMLAERFPFGDGRTAPSNLDDLKLYSQLHAMEVPYPPLEKILRKGLARKPKHRPRLEEICEVLEHEALLDAAEDFPTQPLPPHVYMEYVEAEGSSTAAWRIWLLVLLVILSIVGLYLTGE